MSHELALEQTHSPIEFEPIGKPRTNLNLSGLTQSRKRKKEKITWDQNDLLRGNRVFCYFSFGHGEE